MGAPSTLQLEKPPVRLDVDAELRAHVRPPEWRNPAPADRYDLVVLGGGTAGLVCAMGTAALGGRVALVERHRLGGDCLNSGCVPSKALIRAGRAVGELRAAAAMGIHVSAVDVNYADVVARVHARRAQIAEHDSVLQLRRAGVDVFFGNGRFATPATVIVDGAVLRFRRAVIATGGRPATPPIPGLDRTPFLTNESIFERTELPRRLLVIGAGPIGCELAQAFSRFGARVTVVDQARQILGRDDPGAAAVVRRSLERDGVQFELGVRIDAADSRGGEVQLRLTRDPDGDVTCTTVDGDVLLVAAGRAANVEGLDLEAAGVTVDRDGVTVDERLRTSNRRVYASGDVCSRWKFTHAADAMSRLVIQNALFFGRRKVSSLVIPSVTYTTPELAHVGATHAEVAASDNLATITVPLADVDRAIVDDETDGFVAVHHERGRIRGCTIVAVHAGDMIGEAAYALTHGGTLGQLSSTIHPYPTTAEALRKAGDAYRRQALTAVRRRWLERYFAWTR